MCGLFLAIVFHVVHASARPYVDGMYDLLQVQSARIANWVALGEIGLRLCACGWWLPPFVFPVRSVVADDCAHFLDRSRFQSSSN